MTEFLARFSARRPWATVGAWVALLIIAGLLNVSLLESALSTEVRLSSSAEAEKAGALLESRLRGMEPVNEIVVVQSNSFTVDEPEFQAKVEAVYDAVLALGAGTVEAAIHYYQQGDETLVSPSRKTTMMPLVLAGDINEATSNVRRVVDVVADADREGGFRVLIGGAASISAETIDLGTKDLQQGEKVGIPVALIILLVLFGAVVAAVIPLGLAVVAIVVALGAVALIGQAYQLLFLAPMIIVMIGLAVGIDYSLLIVSRFRGEMARGLGRFESVVRSGATAGRTVLFSGATVVVALCGMLIVPAPFFQSLGLGTILVVVAAVAAALTLLPAVLTILGPKVSLLSVPFLGRASTGGAETSQGGFWAFTTRVVTRFPVISVIAVAVPMIACSVFYFDINTGINGVDTLPEGAQTREAFFVLEEEFSFGLLNPAEIVIDADVNDPRVSAAIKRLATALTNDARFPIPPTSEVSEGGDLTLMTIAIPGEPNSQAAVDTLLVIRDQHIPDAFEGAPAEVYVGGTTALAADLFAIVGRYTPIVFTFVLGLTFFILILVFRSIVIPLKAIIMNLISIGAAYGLLVLVFQKGVATNLLGFQHAEVIDVAIPLFMFAILFGLSMDYHVFLLSRIRERYDQTGNNTEAVAYGLQSTGKIITGAALIMVAVFGAFAAGDTTLNQQIGFGLATAIILDATLVRSILVPASMEMLGRGNWYLPSWLHWLPKFDVETAEEKGGRSDGSA